jgi:hypothetical protein
MITACFLALHGTLADPRVLAPESSFGAIGLRCDKPAVILPVLFPSAGAAVTDPRRASGIAR